MRNAPYPFNITPVTLYGAARRQHISNYYWTEKKVEINISRDLEHLATFIKIRVQTPH